MLHCKIYIALHNKPYYMISTEPIMPSKPLEIENEQQEIEV